VRNQNDQIDAFFEFGYNLACFGNWIGKTTPAVPFGSVL
jgi:hypothetical protein